MARSSSSPSSERDRSPPPTRQRRRSRSRSRSHRTSSPAHRQSASSSGSSRSHQRQRGSPHRGRSVERGSVSRDNNNFDYQKAYHMILAERETQALKRKRNKDDVPIKSVQNLGRGVRKLAALFGEICSIVVQAQAYENNPIPDDHGIDCYSEDTTPEQHAFLAKKRDHERNYSAYVVIDALIPGLAEKIASLQPTEKAGYFTLIQKGANDARSDDFKRISGLIGGWINADMHKPELAVFDHTPSKTVLNEKTGEPEEVRGRAPSLTSKRDTRGVEHDVVGGLLTSTATDWNDAFQRAAARTGGLVHLNGDYFIRLFYHGYQGDPKNPETGFMKSQYLVQSYKAVFTSPSSAEVDKENAPAQKKRRTTVRCVASILNMNGRVTGRSIAYIAVLLWLSLTTTFDWQEEYYGYSLRQMYDFLVDFFEEPEEGTQARERMDALLAWWNEQVFPTHASSAATNKMAVSSRSALLAQRAAMES
ncbi:hypothetical protein C8R46DRAFT_1361864 [Mycena filopes]|nr:hypothetical protein C8R46DRAFT_1361864 [Mycena filopes]